MFLDISLSSILITLKSSAFTVKSTCKEILVSVGTNPIFLCFASELLKGEHLSNYTKVCNSLSQTSTSSMYDSFILAF